MAIILLIFVYNRVMGNKLSHPDVTKTDLVNENVSLKKIIYNLENELINLKSTKYNDIDNNFIDKLNTSIENLVFEGGGIKGISFCGAIQELEKNNLLKNIKRYGGSSVGAIYASLLSIGYTSDEISNIILKTNFTDFVDHKVGYINDFYNLLNNYGYCEGDHFYNWIGTLIKKKTNNENYTFEELWNEKNIDLVITGTNLNTMKTIYYSYRTNPHMYIRDAVRISISIPILFRPIIWDNDVLADGGLIDNYPIHIFDGEYPGEISAQKGLCNANCKTLGLKISSSNLLDFLDQNTITNITGLQSFLYKLLDIFCSYNNTHTLCQKDLIRSIIIDPGNIQTTQFNICDNDKHFLINQGIKATRSFIKIREMLQNKKNTNNI